MASRPDIWAVFEDASKNFDDVRKRLSAGSEGQGAALTPDECALVLGNLKKELPRPNSRPGKDWFEKHEAIAPIARYCSDLTKSNEPLKSAVEKTAEYFGCSKSKVYGARRAIRSPYK